MMLIESWLKPHKESAFAIPNFKLVSVERSNGRNGGGVCMYIQYELANSVVDEYTSQNVSAVSVAIHHCDQPTMTYAPIYHPPGLK